MGLSSSSTGSNIIEGQFEIKKKNPGDRIVALAGNPNVGKSTLFNTLTGLNQHTGNWPGKTVTNAQGLCTCKDKTLVMVDLPGTYSLMASSTEEEIARDFICFSRPDAVIVVCDATCLERNLNLVLQTMEITQNVIVCFNLLDEAAKKGIAIDFERLEAELGVPVVGISARSRQGVETLMDRLCGLLDGDTPPNPRPVKYINAIEEAISILEPAIKESLGSRINSRWLAIKLLDHDAALAASIAQFLEYDIEQDEGIQQKLRFARAHLEAEQITAEKLRDILVSCIVLTAEGHCLDNIRFADSDYQQRDRKIDKIITSSTTGVPIMLALLCMVFWLTITGANYPSRMLSEMFFWLEGKLGAGLLQIGTPIWLSSMLTEGVYRVLAWVISVMLPPMAIFFPIFTLLEDLGYLPRVAFNLDKYFKKACACGKQSLTMCMGFGCNAAGVIGARIIDSPRERLIAILTNNFVPCNGRFPTLIAIISMFFVTSQAGILQSLSAAAMLTGVILLGVLMTFWVSRLLSLTVLKGVPSSFTLELPPYRKPQIGKVIVRSIFDRTLFVLGRAVIAAAPAGLIIWLMANVTIGSNTLLAHCTGLLDPFARLLGLDGVILMAFILGFPANEIVVPIIIMSYMATGSLIELESLGELKALLVDNGWTWLTAINTMLFSLLHWPCSTTCMTIKKETQSFKWTVLAFALPTVIGMGVCFLVASAVRVFGLL